jgi:hypothetical protein
VIEEPNSGAGYIRGNLDLKMVTGRYSAGLVSELAQHVENRTANIFPILDEIAVLEGALNSRPTNTKPAACFNGPVLAGLWHKHYFQASYIPKNILNHWRANEFVERIKSVFGIDTALTKQKVGQIAHAFVLDAYRERSQSYDMTGEWIVFARQDGMNYYLTLGTHLEGDEAIRKRVMACCGEFPELLVLPSI